MKTFVALLRGINVGGNSKLPMEELHSVLEELGAQEIKIYIQSGNVVFRFCEAEISTLPERVGKAIELRRGFVPGVQVLSVEELERAMTENPFQVPDEEGSSLHLGFLAETPKAVDFDKLEKLKAGSERYHLAPRVFYLLAPDGVGKSRLAAGVERILGVGMTDRNWNTVRKLRILANEI